MTDWIRNRGILTVCLLLATGICGGSSALAAAAKTGRAANLQNANPPAAAQTAGAPQTAQQPPAQAQPGTPAPMTGKTAGEYYKNIQVLKDIPADQLLPSMRYIGAALGVECEFCHVRGDFSKDDKTEKQTARKMITMMFGINKDSFNGRREVTCYTCHRASAHPMAVPQLPEAAMAQPGMGGMAGPAGPARPGMPAANQSAPAAPPMPGRTMEAMHHPGPSGPPVPSATEILDKYVAALGGQAAIDKVSTLDEQGTIELPFGNPPLRPGIEIYRKAPDKLLETTQFGGRQLARGFDGSAGWQHTNTTEDVTGSDLTQLKEWAQFIPGLDLVKNPRARVMGTENVNGRMAYRVLAFRPGGREEFYFDQQTGFLLRVASRMVTPLGDLPQDVNYDDYRDAGGIKIPFTIRIVVTQGTRTYRWDKVQVNVPAADTMFAKPAAPPAASQQ